MATVYCGIYFVMQVLGYANYILGGVGLVQYSPVKLKRLCYPIGHIPVRGAAELSSVTLSSVTRVRVSLRALFHYQSPVQGE